MSDSPPEVVNPYYDNMSENAWMVVAFGVAAIAGFVGYWYFFQPGENNSRPLPGKFEPTGDFTFDSKLDVNNKETMDERERDFQRICKAKKDFYYVDLANSTQKLKSVEMPGEINSIEDCKNGISETFKSSTLAAKFFSTGMHAFFSASTPFEFAIKFQAIPQFNDPLYVLIYNKDDIGSFRIFWCGHTVEKPLPMGPNDIWPFTVAFLSDEVKADQKVDEKLKFTYFCRPNSDKSCIVSAEKILQEKGVLK